MQFLASKCEAGTVHAYIVGCKATNNRKGTTMAVLTIHQLIEARACTEQVRKFKRMFGDAVDITPELCVSVATEFDWDFASLHFLSREALAEYHRVTAPARAEYNRVTAQAAAEYTRVNAQTFGALYS